MPTTHVKILTFEYDLPQPYGKGHVCSEAEGDALNKLLTKGLSKGLYKVLAACIARSGGEPKFLSDVARSLAYTQGQEYINDFACGFAVGHDYQRALRIEAERIARTTLEAQLYKQGRSSKDLSDAEKDDAIRRLADSESIRLEAIRRVNVTQEIASRAHSELLGEKGASDVSEE